MKQTLLTTALLITTVLAYAQAPQGINYQAVVRDAGGNELANQAVSLRMTILENNTTTVYQETHSATTNGFGLVNLVIGQGTATQGAFNAIDWSTGNYFAQTEVDVTGGTNYALMGSQQLMSVPYALYAENAGVVANSVDSVTIYLTIDNTAFLNINSSDKTTIHQFNYTHTYPYAGSSLSTEFMAASLQLPHNSKIEEVVVYVQDGQPGSITASLEKHTINSSTTVSVASRNSNDVGGFQNFSMPLTMNSIEYVDNSQYSYRLLLEFEFGGSLNDLRVNNARIKLRKPVEQLGEQLVRCIKDQNASVYE